MPACITHNLFAGAVLKELPEDFRRDLNETAFFWGAQGPDFLFCHRWFPWMGEKYLKPYGNRLHEMDPTVTLGAVRTFLQSHEDPAYRSYVWGLLCHYSLDSTAHPYINALAGQLVAQRPQETRTTMHGEIEAALDAIMLRRETGKLPSELSLGSMFPKNEPVQRRIAKLYKAVILAACGDDVSEEGLFQATSDAHLVFSCLTDRTGLKLRLFDVLEKGRAHVIASHFVPLAERTDVDYANLGGEPWKAGETCSEKSFFQLFEEAQSLARTLIIAFMTCDLAEITQRKPFG